MSIVVRCVKCDASYTVQDQFAGRQFPCRTPGCNTTLIVSASAEPASPGTALAAPQVKTYSAGAAPPPQRTSPSQTAECPHCGGTVGNGPALAGTVVQCPFCSGQFQMPNLAAQVALSPPVAAFATAQIITASLATDDYTECPMCGESIRTVAKRCKHCGETLDPVLRRAEEAERLAERLSDRGSVNVNTKVVVVDRSRREYTGDVGGAVVVEIILGFLGIFGVGHFMNGNVGNGLLFMFGYWFLFAINLALLLVAIGFITLPLTWLCFIIISPIVVASTPPVYYD
jgi:hypothetical protein